MRRIWASPRRRRRLKWASVLTAAVLAVALALVFMRNTAPAHKQVFAKGAPQVYHAPRVVEHTRGERMSAIAVATEFLQTAVLRRHVSRSWALTEPTLHAGFTHREWNSGKDLPFPPFHFRQVRWRPDYSYSNRIGLQVALFPAKGEHQRAQVFYLDMRRHGHGKNERWLVSQFLPAPGPGSSAPGIAEGAGGGVTGLHIAVPAGGKSPLSAFWLLVPLSSLSLIVLLPLGLGIRGFIRNKRAEREYARPLQS
jgi:hypothetical protein